MPPARTRKIFDTVPLLRPAMRMTVFASREEEFVACTRAAAGDKRAIDEVCKRNTRLAASVAMKHLGGLPSSAFADLMQEGLMGVVRALQDFNPERGFRFSTYATWWINAYVQRASKYMRSLVKRIDMQSDLSLDVPLFTDADETHLDALVSPGMGQHEQMERVLLGKAVHKRIKQVEKRLRMMSRAAPQIAIDIVQDRLMAEGADTKATLEEIGDRYGISRERVRQIEAKVIPLLQSAFVAFKDAA